MGEGQVAEDEVRFIGVPQRLTLDDGIVIRRYAETDMAEQVEVINANLDHLAPWMPWAQEPVTLDSQLTFFHESDKGWDEGTNFVYGVYSPSGGLVGGTGFHVRNGPGVLEIGYWLARSAEGKGVMTRVAGALTRAAAAVDGVTRIEIHCDAGNARSAAIPRRLGYDLVRTEERDVTAPGETGRHLIFARSV